MALTGLGLALPLASPRNAHADEPTRVALEVRADCPSQAQVTAELTPLLDGYVVGTQPTEVVAVVEDLGAAYRLRVGEKERVVHDAARRCVERARVAAVFLALNLPARRAVETEQVRLPRRNVPPASVDGAHTPFAPQASRHAGLALRAFVQMEVALDDGATSAGAGGGVVGQLGSLSLSLNGAVMTPTQRLQAEGAPARFELRRLPFTALLGWEASGGVLGWGAQVGLALDLLRLRGEGVPNPDAAYRLNAGLRAAAVLRLHGSRRLATEVMPGFSFFPRTYVARVEPGTTLGETPVWWLGVSLGLKYSVW